MAKRQMSDQHKAALQKGREEGRIVRDYLEALRANKPKRGRKRTEESVRKQLADVEAKIPDANPVDELLLVQKKHDLETELDSMGEKVNMEALENAFVGVAKSYSESKSIAYSSWREVGVPARVLTLAGITRAS